MTNSPFSRRDVLVQGSKLSVLGLGLLTGVSTKALAADNGGKVVEAAQDIDVLNEILGTEHEGIGAYQAFLERKLFRKDVSVKARIFQDHHKSHRDILAEHIRMLGGTPVNAKPTGDYVDDLDIGKIKSQNEALSLIVRLERSAANAYIGMLPSTNDRELVKIAARISADEVLHCTIISELLGLPLPEQALSFGA